MDLRLWITLLAVLAAAAIGCDDGLDDDDTGDDDDTAADDDDDDSGDDDDTGDDDTAPPVEPYISITLYGGTCTEPLPGFRTTFCQGDSCRFGETDSSGVIVYDDLEEGTAVLDVPGHAQSYDPARMFTGIASAYEIPAEGVLEVDVCLPEIDAVVAVDAAGEVAAGAGLTLDLDPEAVDWVDAPEIGAAEVPAEAMWQIEIDGVEVLGAWATYPWGQPSDTPVAAAVPPLDGLACGDAVEFHTMIIGGGDDHEIWELAATGSYDCGADLVVTDAGQGLSSLTWVVVGVPQ